MNYAKSARIFARKVEIWIQIKALYEELLALMHEDTEHDNAGGLTIIPREIESCQFHIDANKSDLEHQMKMLSHNSRIPDVPV